MILRTTHVQHRWLCLSHAAHLRVAFVGIVGVGQRDDSQFVVRYVMTLRAHAQQLGLPAFLPFLEKPWLAYRPRCIAPRGR